MNVVHTEASGVLSRQTIANISNLAVKASRQAINATLANDNVDKKQGKLPDLKTAHDNAVWAAKNAEAAKQNASLANALANPNPPIDSITHSLNFIVTLGASLSPNWTLLRWKGPENGSGSFVSTSGIRTHTLTVALGSPGAITNSETNRVLNNAAFRQAIQSP